MTNVNPIYKATPPTLTDGEQYPLTLNSDGSLRASGAGTAGSPSGGVQSVQTPADGATLTKAAVTADGASKALVSASTSRLSVTVSNPAANAAMAIDPTGGTASLTAGIPLGPGETIEITGKAAQSAMTFIGTNTQVLTVYTGA
jgi:hypothetical protein